MKNVQISKELFINLIKYHFSDDLECFSDDELYDMHRNIKKELQKKLDRITMRSYYTKYKTAETEQEREEARKKYLDEKGVPESFQW